MAILTIAEAKRAGKRAGLAAASWKFDGNTSDATYKHFLKGLADGDPEVLDAYAPPSWLSGEYAGESINELLGSPDTPAQEARQDDVAQAYEYAAEGAYWHELERMARYAVGGRHGPRRFNPVRSGVRQRATTHNPALRFRDLRDRDIFEFDHTGLPLSSGIARGPWIKMGPRTYMKSNAVSELYRVGSINVKVIRLGREGFTNPNPKVTVFHANPKRRAARGSARPILQSSRVYEIAYKHVKDGKAYKHPFKTGVCMELLPDGSIRIYSRTGKRLWKDFR